MFFCQKKNLFGRLNCDPQKLLPASKSRLRNSLDRPCDSEPNQPQTRQLLTHFMSSTSCPEANRFQPRIRSLRRRSNASQPRIHKRYLDVLRRTLHFARQQSSASHVYDNRTLHPMSYSKAPTELPLTRDF